MMTTPSLAQTRGASSGPSSSGAIFWRDNPAQIQREKEVMVPILVKAPDLKKDLRLTVSKARVIKVIDEQTLVLDNKMTVNLTGLYFVYNRNGRGPDAIAAYEALNQEFLNKFVRVYQTRSEDKGRKNSFGHDIGHVVRVDDDAWAQGSLVSSGLARVYITAENPEMAKDLLNFEREARRKKIGFWAKEQWAIKDAAMPETIGGDQFQIVEGQITKIAQRQNNIYLNFGEDWRKDFTVQIPMQQRRLFSRLGMTPMDWAHKTIRVRGWSEDYNGPMISIIHPAQIEFVDEESAPIKYVLPEDF